MAQQKVRAVLLSATPYYQVINDRLVELAARHRIPAFYEWREAVVAGGLMSYNTNRTEVGREIGRYVAQGDEARRSASGSIVKLSVCQSHDCQGTRPQYSRNAARTSRRGGRMKPPSLLLDL
jgi:hypothetical protein